MCGSIRAYGGEPGAGGGAGVGTADSPRPGHDRRDRLRVHRYARDPPPGQPGAGRERERPNQAQHARGDGRGDAARAGPLHAVHPLNRRALTMSLITVLSPVAELRAATTAIPRLPADLRGLTVGFLDNTKHNYDRLVEGIGEALKARHGVARVVHLRKANAATGAGHRILEELAKDGDLR